METVPPVYTQRYYPEAVEEICRREYPALQDVTYLDHAGTTLYSKSLIESYAQELTSSLLGNPHSASASSQLSSSRIDEIRLHALRFFNADPETYDLIFVANATAGIKLVAETLRDHRDSQGRSGFHYKYHAECHTSLIGVRAVADMGSICLRSDEEVEAWISKRTEEERLTLFAYPAQSNLNGRRLPLQWCRGSQQTDQSRVLTLLDAASMVSTSPLDLGDSNSRPDFVVLSFYKIFGFPDLGALLVRKDVGHVFQYRRYFGGGTVDMVLAIDTQWHAKKNSTIHEQLEDGTLPFHTIIALDSALKAHKSLYGSMANVSAHTSSLAHHAFERLSALKHSNGSPVCHFYISPGCSYSDGKVQGPIIAFNLRDSHGQWVAKSEVEKLASVKNIHLRTGTLCNPAGASIQLGLHSDEMLQNYKAGQRCGDDHDLMQGKPTGLLRVSFGAMSCWNDVITLVSFIEEFYVHGANFMASILPISPAGCRFYVEMLCVYPIKSCGSFKIPAATQWQINREGLAWDREWCLIHQGTGAALNQKKCPRMALIRPVIDLESGLLRISCGINGEHRLDISLTRDDPKLVSQEMAPRKSSNVCGDRVTVQVYSQPEVSAFFSDFLEIPCSLARLPPHTTSRQAKGVAVSHSVASMRQSSRMPGSFPDAVLDLPPPPNPILLSNESPILLISRSSINSLNESIKTNSGIGNDIGKAVAADVFRANIVVAEDLSSPSLVSTNNSIMKSMSTRFEQPYLEDTWTSIDIGSQKLSFDDLGPCQRCQMVCIDQFTAERRAEPLTTLAKTRRINGKVYFGRHLGLSPFVSDGEQYIRIGDAVVPSNLST